MKRIATLLVALGVALSGCDKPTPEDCEKALLNMKRLLGTENLGTASSLQGEIRRCRGGSTREAVQCAIKASSLDELKACDFEKKTGSGAGK